MRYVLSICTSESDDAALSHEQMAGILEGYGKLTQDMESAGVRETSARLRPVADATTVRVRDGDLQVTDGPFAETKEQVGGFYLIDVEDLDAAIAWARRIPCAARGCIEVRPVWEPEDYEDAG